MEKIISKLKNVTGKKVFILFLFFIALYIITNLVFMFVLGSIGIKGVTLLDSRIGYTSREAYNVLNSFTEKGRGVIVYAYIMDFIIPLLYSLFFAAFIAYLLQKNKITSKNLYYISLIPFLAALFDYCENIFFLMMIINFSTASVNGLTPFSNLATQLKATFTVISIVIIIFTAVLLFGKMLLRNRKANTI